MNTKGDEVVAIRLAKRPTVFLLAGIPPLFTFSQVRFLRFLLSTPFR